MAASMCVFFMRGTCRFGNRCWNSHDMTTNRIISPSEFLSSEESEDSFNPFYSSQSSPDPSEHSSSSRAQPQVVSEPAPKPQKDQTGDPQPLWNLTNSSSGEKREGTPDSMLVEAVKKLNEAENLVKTLRQQLRLKDESDNFSWVEHQMEQCVDNDLQCNICYELFIKPTVLNCSHTFCHECIETWTRRVNHCPTCRVYIKSKVYCLTLDSFLDKIADCLPEDIKTRRDSLKVERNNSRETNRSGRNNQPPRRRRNHSMRRTLGVLWGERDRDGAEWNIALEEALIDPIRLGDVLGRNNRNDRDDWDDNLSDSSLDSNNGVYGYRLCSYCDNMGHTASNCPLSQLEEEYGQW